MISKSIGGEGDFSFSPNFYEINMTEVLSEINIGNSTLEPIMNVLKRKKEPKMLEEQIRYSYPCDVEPEDEKNEEL